MREAHKSSAIILLWHNNREQKEHQRLSSEQNRAPSEENRNLCVNTIAWTFGPLERQEAKRCMSVPELRELRFITTLTTLVYNWQFSKFVLNVVESL